MEAVEELLQWEEEHHKAGELYVNINLQIRTRTPPEAIQKHSCNYKQICVLAELGGGGPGAVDVHPGHHSADAGGALQQLRNHQNSVGSRGHVAFAARREV